MRPGLNDQIMRLMETLVGDRRIQAERVIFGTDTPDKTGNQAPTGNHVEHGILFGHRHGMLTQRQRTTQNGNLHAFCAARQSRSHDHRGRHQAIGSLVMLIHSHAVKTQGFRILQFIKVAVVQLVTFHRVIKLVRQLHPNGFIFLGRLEIQIGIRHQVKKNDIHDYLTPSINCLTDALNSLGYSTCGK